MSTAKIRIAEAPQPETPPAGRVWLWFDELVKKWQYMKSDGVPRLLADSDDVSMQFQKKIVNENVTVPDGYTWIRGETSFVGAATIKLNGNATIKFI
jgi:hypothetical protein